MFGIMVAKLNIEAVKKVVFFQRQGGMKIIGVISHAMFD